MNVATERINRGLSLHQAAREIGVARGTLKRFEGGEPVHPASAKKIADFFGVQVTDLWPVEAPEAA